MPTLTLRKLIKFGEGGLVITVPKGWFRYYGLKAGDRLEVIANEELVICTERKSKRTLEKLLAKEETLKEITENGKNIIGLNIGGGLACSTPICIKVF